LKAKKKTKLNLTKTALVLSAVAGGVFLVDYFVGKRMKAAELEEATKLKLEEQKAAGEPKNTLVQTILNDPKVAEKVDELGDKATGMVKDLLSKLGIG